MSRATRVGFTDAYLGRTRPFALGVRVARRDPRQTAFVDGVVVEIPARVDGSGRAIVRAPARDRHPIALLLGSRHYDGHVREACVAVLAERAEGGPDHFPFLLLAIGDYVEQVSERAATSLLSWNADDLRYYALSNPALVALVRARTVSYGIGVDATTRLQELIAGPDWFSRALVDPIAPTHQEFDKRIDAQFPYFDETAWRAAIELAHRVSPWSEWQVCYEIICVPGRLNIGRDLRLAMLEVWAARFGREPATLFLALGTELITQGRVPRDQLLAARSAIGGETLATWMLDNLSDYVDWPRGGGPRQRRIRKKK